MRRFSCTHYIATSLPIQEVDIRAEVSYGRTGILKEVEITAIYYNKTDILPLVEEVAASFLKECYQTAYECAYNALGLGQV